MALSPARKRKADTTDDGGEIEVDQSTIAAGTKPQSSAAAKESSADEATSGLDLNDSNAGGGCSGSADAIGGDQGWSPCFRDDEIMQQQYEIKAEEAAKIPFVGDKEPISALAAEYQSGSPILLEKIKLIGEQYEAMRRTRGDGNCFFRSFMFSYLEHILETQDEAEVARVLISIEQCKQTLHNLGYIDFTFEDFFSTFVEQLENVLQGKETSISHDELLKRSRDQSFSDCGEQSFGHICICFLISSYFFSLLLCFCWSVVMFFRFITTGEIRKRADFFEPFITGLTNSTVDQFCKSSVEPMGEESDHVHITALSDALGVPIRVVYLDRSSCEAGPVTVNHHNFIPSASDAEDGTTSDQNNPPNPFIVLLYRPGHYDILYPK